MIEALMTALLAGAHALAGMIPVAAPAVALVAALVLAGGALAAAVRSGVPPVYVAGSVVLCVALSFQVDATPAAGLLAGSGALAAIARGAEGFAGRICCIAGIAPLVVWEGSSAALSAVALVLGALAAGKLVSVLDASSHHQPVQRVRHG